MPDAVLDWILTICFIGVLFWPRLIDWFCDWRKRKAESAHISFQADSD